MPAVVSSPVRNCTIQRVGLGALPALSSPHPFTIRRRCCPTAGCWLREELVAAAAPSSPAPKCMIRQVEPGAPRVISARRAVYTVRPSCLTETFSSREAITVRSVVSWRARNCMTLQTGRGLSLAALKPPATDIRRHCYPTAGCLLLEGFSITRLSQARNCTIRQAGDGMTQQCLPPRAICTQPPYCPTARGWSPEEAIASGTHWRARNCFFPDNRRVLRTSPRCDWRSG